MTNTAADPSRLGYVGKTSGRDSDSWFTPSVYIDAARSVLGGIGLDPFSSVEANEVVKAESFMTIDDDSLAPARWVCPAGRPTVWMNPPYGGSLVRQAANKFLEEFKAGSFERAVVLVNNATETKMFQALLREASAVCFTDHRIAFWNSDGKQVSGNTRGQAFLYFGAEPARFASEFEGFGFTTEINS